MFATGILILSSLLTSSAFVVPRCNNNCLVPLNKTPKPTKTFMSDDQPSDSSSEFAVDVQSDESYTPSESETIVMSILDDLPSSLGDVDNDIRTRINEELIKLEALNPTESPAMSNLLNGVWILRYSGGYASDWTLPSPTRQIALFLYSGGYSPGLFLLTLAKQLPESLVDIGELQISISRDQPRIEAKVNTKILGNEDNEIVLDAMMDVLSDVRIRETYDKFAKVVGREVAIPEALQYSREMYITYLDDDLLVVRDASGIPEILVRK